MIDAVEFKKVVESYYNDFTQRYWDKEEGFKWKAVKAFSEKWDIDSSDFSAMLKAALKETKPLLMGPNYFSFGMIGEFADAEPETVRQMFRDLYDESADLAWRFDNFKKQSIKLLSVIGKADKNHYQDEHAISIYLWLRYPAKYYWAILYEGKKASKKADGVFIWKLRDELAKAWEKYEMSQSGNLSTDKHYWMMSAKPALWKVSTFPVGGVMDVSMFAPSGNKSRIYQHFLDVKIGDVVILYESNPTKKIVAIGEIAGEQDEHRILIRKTEGLENPRSCNSYTILRVFFATLKKMGTPALCRRTDIRRPNDAAQ